jgi:hypothetical protein
MLNAWNGNLLRYLYFRRQWRLVPSFFDSFSSEGNGEWFLPSIPLLQKAIATGSFLLRYLYFRKQWRLVSFLLRYLYLRGQWWLVFFLLYVRTRFFFNLSLPCTWLQNTILRSGLACILTYYRVRLHMFTTGVLFHLSWSYFVWQ